MKLKEKIVAYVSRSQLKETFQLLLHEEVIDLLDEGEQEKIYLASGKYNRLRSNEVDGLISRADAEVEHTRISKSILTLVEDWDLEVEIKEPVTAAPVSGPTGNFSTSANGHVHTPSLEIAFVTEFLKMYEDRGTGGKLDLSIWRPELPQGFFALGYYAQASYYTPRVSMAVVKPIDKTALAYPIDFRYVWDDKGSGGAQDVSIWEPVPPLGYKALGSVISLSYNRPALDSVMCVREDLVAAGQVGEFIYNDSGTGSKKDLSLWKIRSTSNDYLPTGSFCGHTAHSELSQSPVAQVLKVR